MVEKSSRKRYDLFAYAILSVVFSDGTVDENPMTHMPPAVGEKQKACTRYHQYTKTIVMSFFDRCGALVKDLKEHKNTGGGGGGKDQQYCLLAMELLGRVAGSLADITRCGTKAFVLQSGKFSDRWC